ncbi:MAG: hypothetical protein HY819_11135 [Acidobacteria bacterium]|nr:hypothetical protein [Acidobacteriota bacterium]
MSNLKVINTNKEVELAPGKTYKGHWNNATPGANAVWGAQAIPLATGSTIEGFAQDTSVEVTRLWRRLIITEKKPFPQSQTVETEVEHEIHYEIKNVGTEKVKFIIFLTIMW